MPSVAITARFDSMSILQGDNCLPSRYVTYVSAVASYGSILPKVARYVWRQLLETAILEV
jgi:hypothetical protein